MSTGFVWFLAIGACSLWAAGAILYLAYSLGLWGREPEARDYMADNLDK